MKKIEKRTKWSREELVVRNKSGKVTQRWTKGDSGKTETQSFPSNRGIFKSGKRTFHKGVEGIHRHGIFSKGGKKKSW